MHRDILIDSINQIIGHELLEKAAQKDSMANGAQILGGAEVTQIAFGVSCNAAFLEQAAAWGAQMCVFHHGLDVRTSQSRLPISMQKQLKIIFAQQLTIMGFHYALDAHPEIGNNAEIIKQLNGIILEPLYDEWGYVAELKSPVSVKQLIQVSQALFKHPVLHFGNQDREVQRIGVVSGGAIPDVNQMQELVERKVELYLSGETSEWIPHQMMETEIEYLLCGHYATETLGVQALEHKINQKHPEIKTTFISIDNPI